MASWNSLRSRSNTSAPEDSTSCCEADRRPPLRISSIVLLSRFIMFLFLGSPQKLLNPCSCAAKRHRDGGPRFAEHLSDVRVAHILFVTKKQHLYGVR